MKKIVISKHQLSRLFGFRFNQNILGEYENGFLFDQSITSKEIEQIVNGEHYLNIESKEWVTTIPKRFKKNVDTVLCFMYSSTHREQLPC